MDVNAADTTWVLISTGLVFLMLPGVVFLEIGFLRAKNAVSVMMQVFTILCITSIVFLLVGFTLSYGKDIGGVIGNMDFVGLKDIGTQVWQGTTIPAALFFLFQLMFAAVTIALVTGAIAERMSYKAFLIFVVGFAFIYAFPAHWVWGGGWLQDTGTVDFAGSIVVHATAGVAAVLCAIMLGRRQGFETESFTGHSLPFGVLGAFILWFGWFGFNGGSALAINDAAINAVVSTNTAAAAGALMITILTWFHMGRPSIVMAINGSLAGLAAVTGGCAYISPLGALVIGLVAGAINYYAIQLIKHRLKVDDALDVSSIHGLPGLWGALAVGLFADGRLGGVNGLFHGGGWHQLGVQALGVFAVIAFVAVCTTALLYFIKATVGLRATSHDEITGLDLADHREAAYG
jgi:Amt family ammonium transporter